MFEEIWKSLTFSRVVTVIALFLFAMLVLTLWNSDAKIDLARFGNWLEEAGKVNMARGLITFLVVLVTVLIALILVLSLFFGDFQQRKERFMLGKEILTIFIGILGTIMGFYYAEGTVAVEKIGDLKNAVQATSGEKKVSIEEAEKQAFKAFFEKDFDSASDLFSKAYQINPTWRNIDEINKILKSRKDAFKEADEAKKTELWKEIYCQVATEKKTYGMSADDLKKFRETVKSLNCQPE